MRHAVISPGSRSAPLTFALTRHPEITAVPVLDDDTPETLHQRIHAVEHELYPACVAALASGRVQVAGQRVIISGA